MSKKKRRSPPPAFATATGTWHTHYVILFDDLLNSPAYIALSASAKEAYTILMQEYKGDFTGPKVTCPYSTFQKKGIRSNTLSKALLQLETYGFVRIEHGGLERKPNIYHLSSGWQKIQTEEDLKQAEKAFQDEIDKRKLAKEMLKRETEGYGKYISSNESVSCQQEKEEETGNETDSKEEAAIREQETKAFLEQVQKALVENEANGPLQ